MRINATVVAFLANDAYALQVRLVRQVAGLGNGLEQVNAVAADVIGARRAHGAQHRIAEVEEVDAYERIFDIIARFDAAFNLVDSLVERFALQVNLA